MHSVGKRIIRLYYLYSFIGSQKINLHKSNLNIELLPSQSFLAYGIGLIRDFTPEGIDQAFILSCQTHFLILSTLLLQE